MPAETADLTYPNSIDSSLENSSLLDAHALLTEVIPTVIIEPEVQVSPDGMTGWGQLYNPGKTPNLEKLGLALSQVAATIRLSNLEPGAVKKRTPMVSHIASLNLTDWADQNFTSNALLGLEVNLADDGGGVIGRVMLEGIVLCEAEMTVSDLPLLKAAMLDRVRSRVPSTEWTEPVGTSLPDLPMPGFGDQWVITNRIESKDHLYGTLEVPEGLFKGHFPQVDIIPIAGSARPGFWLAEEHWARTQQRGHSEVQQLEGLSIPAPLKPNDVLDYRLTPLAESGTYRVEVFFREGGTRRLAARFDKIKLGLAERKSQLWQHPNVADAFGAQGQIPSYPEHIDAVVSTVVEAIIARNKPDLVVADIGTGVGRIIKAVLADARLDLEAGHTQVHLTDVSPRALALAEQNLTERFRELMDERLAIVSTLVQKSGVIIPDDLSPQDVIVGNFSFYGNLDEAFAQAYQRLNPGGVLVLGMVHENPNYNGLLLSEAERLAGNFQADEYRHDLVMSDVGMDLCEDALLHRSQCEYVNPNECEARLKQAGFKVEVVEESSFCGIGYIIKGYKV